MIQTHYIENGVVDSSEVDELPYGDPSFQWFVRSSTIASHADPDKSLASVKQPKANVAETGSKATPELPVWGDDLKAGYVYVEKKPEPSSAIGYYVKVPDAQCDHYYVVIGVTKTGGVSMIQTHYIENGVVDTSEVDELPYGDPSFQWFVRNND